MHQLVATLPEAARPPVPDARPRPDGVGDPFPAPPDALSGVLEEARAVTGVRLVLWSRAGTGAPAARAGAAPCRRTAGAPADLRHTYTVPVELRGQPYAALAFHDVRPFTAARRRLCRVFARQAALTLENACLATELREEREKLRRLWGHAMEAEERVRAEVSELLHGTVQTRLTVAASTLETCKTLLEQEPEEARSVLTRVQEEIDRLAAQDVREASHLLHPAIIRVGLLPAIRSLARSYGDRLHVSVEADGELARLDGLLENRIPYPLRLNAYRIVEEALNNVLAHAGTPWAKVRLAVRDGRHLELEVADGGRGFDPATGRTGLGLSIIEARVEQAGGVWSVESRAGCGTTLVAWLPLDGAAPEAGARR
ncbi:MAG TPA: ATP-binding protein [Dehalococcoidia bacterium]